LKRFFEGAHLALSPEILGIVWAETGDLSADDGAPALARLQAAVARIANRAPADERASAFPSRVFPGIASEDRTAFDQMRVAAEAGATGQFNGLDLPEIVMLLEINAAGRPIIPPGGYADWQRRIIDATPVAPAFTQRGGDPGRKFGLFERKAAPVAGESRFISDVSGAGRAPAMRKPNLLSKPFLLLYAAALLFAYVAGTVMWTGRTTAEAHALMAHKITAGSDAFDKLLASSPMCEANKDSCAAINKTVDTKLCLTAASPLSRDCLVAWRLSLLAADRPGEWLQDSLSTVFGTHVRNTASASGEMSLGLPMAGMMASVSLFVMAIGLGLKQHPLGVWINSQNRMSLARAQVSLWTLVILGGYGLIALFNVAFVGIDADNVFPSMNAALFLGLGISFVSPMASKLILNQKEDDSVLGAVGGSFTAQGEISRFTGLVATSTLLRYPSPLYATVMDFFTGEEEGNKGEIDISRVQNVIVTMILVVAYGGFLFARVRNLPVTDIFSAINVAKPLFPAMPDVDTSFNALLAISHSAYLAAKATPK